MQDSPEMRTVKTVNRKYTFWEIPIKDVRLWHDEGRKSRDSGRNQSKLAQELNLAQNLIKNGTVLMKI
jgi:hypothetical protein